MEELEKVGFEIINEEKKFDFDEFYRQNREIIFVILFYFIGLIIGAFLYCSANSDSLNKLLFSEPPSFTVALVSNLFLYAVLSVILLFMGFSLIGFAFMNVVPAFCGIFYGLKGACYFSLYNYKGAGYIILMIAPLGAFLLTAITYSILCNTQLSKSIYNSFREKEIRGNTFSIKPLIIQNIIQLVLFIAVALFNAFITVSLGNIITI